MPPAYPPKTITWGPDSQAALDEWLPRAKALGLPVTYSRLGRPEHSDSAAIREALRHATSCRCMEADVEAQRDMERAAADLAEAHRHATGGATIDRILEPANPLRALRTAAGLNQREAAARLGITRGALATAEARSTCSEDYARRAREAWKKSPA